MLRSGNRYYSNYNDYQSKIYVQNRTFNFGRIMSNSRYQTKDMKIQNLSVLNNVNVNANNTEIDNLYLYMSGPAYYQSHANSDNNHVITSILQSDRLFSGSNVKLNTVQLNLGRVQLVDCQVSNLIASSYIQDVNSVKKFQLDSSGTNPAQPNITYTTSGYKFDYTTRMY